MRTHHSMQAATAATAGTAGADLLVLPISLVLLYFSAIIHVLKHRGATEDIDKVRFRRHSAVSHRTHQHSAQPRPTD